MDTKAKPLVNEFVVYMVSLRNSKCEKFYFKKSLIKTIRIQHKKKKTKN